MDTFTVEFRIEGGGMSPNQITEALGLDPCMTRDQSVVRGGRTLNALWSYDGGFARNNEEAKTWLSIEEAMSDLVEKLLPKRDAIHAKLGGANVYWWCGHFKDSFDGGYSLSSALLEKLALLGAPIEMSCYVSETPPQ